MITNTFLNPAITALHALQLKELIRQKEFQERNTLTKSSLNTVNMKKEPCLYPGCPNSVKTRGLCGRHYAMAVRAVRDNVTTWETLIAEKKCHKIPGEEKDFFKPNVALVNSILPSPKVPEARHFIPVTPQALS